MTTFKPPSIINRRNRCVSPFYVPSAANRHVPENLILEMASGVFFSEEKRGKDELLQPQMDMDAKKRFAVNALRGREAKGRKSQVANFFAPIYPSLARGFGISRKHGDMIENFFWQGPIAYGLKMRDARPNGADSKKMASLVVKALAGDTAKPRSEKSDIFALACGSDDIDLDHLSDKLANKLSRWQSQADLLPRNNGNSLATRAIDDFELLLKIEPCLPRHHWITLLMCYLRLTLPIWCFSQARGAEILDRLLVQCLTEAVPSKKEIEKEYEKCSQSLFCPSDNWSTIIDDRIRTSILARIRTDALLKDLADAGCREFKTLTHDNNLSISTDDSSENIISVHTLLQRVHNNRDRYTKYLASKKEYEDIDQDEHQVLRCLNRLCEQDTRFLKPVTCTLGKRLKEFTSYLLRECISGDERGSHLLRWRSYPKMIWQVSPGPLVLQLFTLLAFCRKTKAGRGELVLLDLEEHLAIYGIDYSKQPNGRSLLINSLTRRGLLVGSPDAGEGAKLHNPYKNVLGSLDQTINGD